MKTLQSLDYLVLTVYMLLSGGIGLYIARAQKTSAQYFVADRKIPTWAVAFTLMATIISSGTMVGHPATVYKDHMMLLLGSLTLPVVLVFVAIYIVPFYRRSVKMSAYEYLESRLGSGARIYSSFGFLADRIFDVGGTLIAVGITMKVMTGWDIVLVIIVIGAFTTIYTSLGGIEAVVWTDVAQGIILLGGIALMLAFLLFTPAAGAPFAVVGEAWRGGKFHLGSFELSWDSLFTTGSATQWMFIIVYFFNWCRRYITDQHLVQRYLIARTDAEASKGALWGAISCVPIWASCMFIGACLYGFYQLTGKPAGDDPNDIVPYFIMNEMPVGIIGLMLAAILAAAMSTISADLNSIATVITTDYFVKFRPGSSDKARLLTGRLMVFVGGVLMTLCAYWLIPREGQASLMERMVTVAAILSGGTFGLFALGFFTKRATRAGCYVGIVACLIFTAWGVVTNRDTRWIDMGFNFTMHPMLIGIFSHFVLFGVGYAASLLLGGYKPQDIDRYTIWGARKV